METTHYYYLVRVYLAYALALSGSQENGVSYIQQFPLVSLGTHNVRRVEGQSLNLVKVLLGFVGDAAEDVDVAVGKGAAGVIVSARVDVTQLVPSILVSVEDLCPELGLLDILPRSCDYDEVLAQAST